MTDTTLKPIEALKPCPFCNSPARLWGAQDSSGFESIGCSNAECEFEPSTDYMNIDEATKCWNTRTAPKVKDLVWTGPWQPCGSSVVTQAKTIIGNYDILKDGDEFYVSYSVMGVEMGIDGDDEFTSLDLAKAAAQSHYEQTILSALDT